MESLMSEKKKSKKARWQEKVHLANKAEKVHSVRREHWGNFIYIKIIGDRSGCRTEKYM